MNPIESFSNASRTVRPLRSFGFFGVLSLGFLLVGFDPAAAIFNALPMYPICMAGFAINDIFDQETDRINHPDRALVHFPALTNLVAAIYSVLFILSIALILMQKDAVPRSLWAIFFLLLSNYSLIKKYMPPAKNAYIAASACIVLSLLDVSAHEHLSPMSEYLPFAFAVFARELAGDVEDIAGDQYTLATELGSKWGCTISLLIYGIALLVLIFQAHTPVEFAFVSMAFVLLVFYTTAKLKARLRERPLVAVSGAMVACHAILIVN